MAMQLIRGVAVENSDFSSVSVGHLCLFLKTASIPLASC